MYINACKGSSYIMCSTSFLEKVGNYKKWFRILEWYLFLQTILLSYYKVLNWSFQKQFLFSSQESKENQGTRNFYFLSCVSNGNHNGENPMLSLGNYFSSSNKWEHVIINIQKPLKQEKNLSTKCSLNNQVLLWSVSMPYMLDNIVLQDLSGTWP